LLDILYDKNYLRREIYAELTTPEGQVYKGACIPTTGTQAGAVQAKRTLQVTLQWQGCSFKFTHGTDAAVIEWPGASVPSEGSNWALAGGLWNDNGTWDDNQSWSDN